MLIERIVSGGQTGADRAGLDWSLEQGVPHEGWCPAGRRAEDGPIGTSYRLQETPGEAYEVRTKWNVRDSDATVIFSMNAVLTGGSLATRRFAARLGKPWLHLWRGMAGVPDEILREFVQRHEVKVLNVAGPRASSEPEVGEFVKEVLSAAFPR